jgi:hypothetical protein
VVAVGQLMADDQSTVINLDINPVVVGSAGEGCRAIDAVVYTILQGN